MYRRMNPRRTGFPLAVLFLLGMMTPVIALAGNTHTEGGAVVFNIEALLATKTKSERECWLASFLERDWGSVMVLPLTLFASDVTSDSGRVLHLDAETLPEQSLLSRFLRQEMYARTAATDIDFVIARPSQKDLTIIEEKSFMIEGGGSIGLGQYLSFREIIADVLSFDKENNIQFCLLFIDEADPGEAYVYDFLAERNTNPRDAAFYDSRRRQPHLWTAAL